MHWSENLQKNAYSDAVEWCRTQPSIKAAWDNCERGDWMLFLLTRKVKQGSDKHRKIVLAVCECARLSLKYMKKGEKRPLKAIQTAEKWAKRVKGVSLEEVVIDVYAVTDTADTTYATAATVTAAAAAAIAASTAYICAYAASACACAAYACAYDADTFAVYADYANAPARRETLKKCADIVRKYFTYRSVIASCRAA